MLSWILVLLVLDNPAVSSVQSNLAITVNGTNDTSVTLEAGQTLVLVCRVADPVLSPNVFYTWSLPTGREKYEDYIPPEGRVSNRTTNGEGTLVLSDTTTPDTGFYSCSAPAGFNDNYVARIFVYFKDPNDTTHLFCQPKQTPLAFCWKSDVCNDIKCFALDPNVTAILYGGNTSLADNQYTYDPRIGMTLNYPGNISGYSVSCRAKNSDGEEIDSVKYHFLNSDKPTFIPKPTINTKNAQWAYKGGNMTIQCTVLNNPLPALAFCKFIPPPGLDINDKRVSVQKPAASGENYFTILTVENLKQKDSGTYVCKCFIKSLNLSNSNSVDIKVSDTRGQVRIWNYTRREEIVEPGTDMEYEVDYSAYPTAFLSVSWTHSYVDQTGVVIHADISLPNLKHKQESPIESFDVRMAALKLSDLQVNNSGNYTCQIFAYDYSQNMTFSLSVIGAPEPSFVKQPGVDYRNLYKGSTQMVKCSAVGMPLPDVELSYKECMSGDQCDWMTISQDSINIPNVTPRGGGAYTVTSGTFAKLLTMRTMAASSGTFRCTAISKEEGTKQAYLEYIVTDLPVTGNGMTVVVDVTNPPLPPPEPTRPVHHDSPKNTVRSQRSGRSFKIWTSGSKLVVVRKRRAPVVTKSRTFYDGRLGSWALGGVVSHSARRKEASLGYSQDEHRTRIKRAGNNSNILLGDDVTLTCKAQKYDFEIEETWYYQNNSSPLFIPVRVDSRRRTETASTPYSNKFKLIIHNSTQADVGTYSCRAERFGETETRIYRLDLQATSKPVINPDNSSKPSVSAKYQSGLNLRCDANGKPKPRLSWYRNGKLFEPNGYSIQLQDDNKTLHFIRLVPEDQAGYECYAESRIGHDSRSIDLMVTGGAKRGLSITTIVLIVVFFGIALISLFILIGFVVFMKKRDKRRKEMLSDLYRQLKASADNKPSINPRIPIQLQAENLPYDFRYEIPSDQVVMDKLIGQGQFGKVFQGLWLAPSGPAGGLPVAVKTPRDGMNIEHQRSLLSELKIMIHVGNHANVLNLVGAVTKHMVNGKLSVLTEFCQLGSMDQYLRNRRKKFVNEIEGTGAEVYRTLSQLSAVNNVIKPLSLENKHVDTTQRYKAELNPGWPKELANYRRLNELIATSDLIGFAFQVANGMDYLASKNVNLAPDSDDYYFYWVASGSFLNTNYLDFAENLLSRRKQGIPYIIR